MDTGKCSISLLSFLADDIMSAVGVVVVEVDAAVTDAVVVEIKGVVAVVVGVKRKRNEENEDDYGTGVRSD